VDGLLVIPEGAAAIGLVTDAEPKKRMGHGGKLALSINFVRLKDDEKAAVRSFQESTGSNNSTGAVLPLSSGKETGLSGRKRHFQHRAGPPSSKSVPAARVLKL